MDKRNCMNCKERNICPGADYETYGCRNWNKQCIVAADEIEEAVNAIESKVLRLDGVDGVIDDITTLAAVQEVWVGRESRK